MKKSIGISVLLVLFAIPAIAQDYTITCYPVSITGKLTEDGYITSDVRMTGLTLYIDGVFYSQTSDRYLGYLYDADENLLVKFSGNVVWSQDYKKISIVGTRQNFSEDDPSVSFRGFYLDGTLKASRNRYTLSAKGGETDTFDQIGYPFVASFSKISSNSCCYEELQ